MDLNCRAGALLVAEDGEDGFRVKSNVEILALCRVDGGGDVGPHLGYAFLDGLGVDVAHDDDALEVGAIPFVIICADGVVREVVDDGRIANDVADGIAGAGHGIGHVGEIEAA